MWHLYAQRLQISLYLQNYFSQPFQLKKKKEKLSDNCGLAAGLEIFHVSPSLLRIDNILIGQG